MICFRIGLRDGTFRVHMVDSNDEQDALLLFYRSVSCGDIECVGVFNSIEAAYRNGQKEDEAGWSTLSIGDLSLRY